MNKMYFKRSVIVDIQEDDMVRVDTSCLLMFPYSVCCIYVCTTGYLDYLTKYLFGLKLRECFLARGSTTGKASHDETHTKFSCWHPLGVGFGFNFPKHVWPLFNRRVRINIDCYENLL